LYQKNSYNVCHMILDDPFLLADKLNRYLRSLKKVLFTDDKQKNNTC
jgi:hypothetical protein